MKILLLGKHELAVHVWKELRAIPDVLCEVVTCGSEGAGGQRASLKRALAADGIEPLNGDFTHAELLRCTRDFGPEVILSLGYDKIIRKEVLDSVAHAVNVHFGHLPRYRGNHSIPWAILNNERLIGVTLHCVDVGIDSGAIVLQTTFPNDAVSSCRDLYLQAVAIGGDLVHQYLDGLASGKVLRVTPQDETKATYYPPEYPGGFVIPWRQTVTYVRDYIRAAHFPPFPSARTTIGDQPVFVPAPVDLQFDQHGLPPGQVVQTDRGWGITTLNGYVLPREVNVDGQLMPFARFVVQRNCEGCRIPA